MLEWNRFRFFKVIVEGAFCRKLYKYLTLLRLLFEASKMSTNSCCPSCFATRNLTEIRLRIIGHHLPDVTTVADRPTPMQLYFRHAQESYLSHLPKVDLMVPNGKRIFPKGEWKSVLLYTLGKAKQIWWICIMKEVKFWKKSEQKKVELEVIHYPRIRLPATPCRPGTECCSQPLPSVFLCPLSFSILKKTTYASSVSAIRRKVTCFWHLGLEVSTRV